MLHFPLCQESVMGKPRIEIEFEFDMVFCFAILGFNLQDIARPVESDRPIIIVFICPSVRPSVRSSVVGLWMYNSATAWDRFMQF